MTAQDRQVFVRLCAMMLLEFVVFGAWFATLGLVLSTAGLPQIIGPAYSLSAVAAILSPLLLGALGDRFINAEKVLALAHLAGASAMFALPFSVGGRHHVLTLALVFVHMLAFMPTLGLVNSIALRCLGPQVMRFPYIRVFGPLGWVVAGLLVGGLGFSASVNVFYVAGTAGLALFAYALTLPANPPLRRDRRLNFGDLIGRDALVLFRDRNFSVLILCALLTSVSLGIYNTFTSPFLGVLGIGNVAGVLAIGQISEVAFIVTIPFVLRTIGMKWALLGGMTMWGVRFTLFALATEDHTWAAILGVALHGICNDFFIVVAAMFIDRIAPAHLAAQAQGWLIMVISGFGSLVGAWVSGAIFAATIAPFPEAGATAWVTLWLVPIAAALATALIWTAGFRMTEPAPQGT